MIHCEVATVRVEIGNLMLTYVYPSAILATRPEASGKGPSWDSPGVSSRLARTHLNVMKGICVIYAPSHQLRKPCVAGMGSSMLPPRTHEILSCIYKLE